MCKRKMRPEIFHDNTIDSEQGFETRSPAAERSRLTGVLLAILGWMLPCFHENVQNFLFAFQCGTKPNVETFFTIWNSYLLPSPIKKENTLFGLLILLLLTVGF